MSKKKTINKKTSNNTLINLIAPIGFRFYKNKVDIGENTGKVYGITKYNENVDYGWFEPLMNIPGSIATINYTPLPEGDCSDVINSNMNVIKRKLEQTTDELSKKRLQRAWDNSDKMLDDISAKQESVGAVSTTIMTLAPEQYIDEADSRLRGEIKKGRHRYRLLANMQKEGYRTISPCFLPDKEINNVLDRIAPLKSIMGGFPFASSGYNDGSGYLFATLSDSSNSTSSNMILDLWKRGQDRNNSNLVIMGESGSGKSTKLKDIELMEYALGTKIIVIDPEREQKALCKKLKGNWINAGGGSGRINPLQVRPLPTDPDEDEEDTGLPSLAAFLMHLKAWFQMACPDITISQLNMLEEMLILTYAQFNMGWDSDFDSFKNEEYPILSDLLNVIESNLETIEEERKRDMLKVKDYIKNMVTGSLQFLWNGHTTINFDSDFIVLDTFDLQDTPDYIKGAQYYNILTWVWHIGSLNREEKTLIVADEAYLLIDRRIPTALVFLRNSLKRARKYEIAFAIVSHSVVDFLDEEIKKYGEAILDSSSIKILMGCDGKNLEDTVKLYNLTEAEEETIAMKQRGLAIMIIGRMHMKVKFEIAEYKWEYFGSAGGR